MSDKIKAGNNTAKVITANRLSDGFVVFLSPDNKWIENIAEAKNFSAVELDALPPSVLTKVIDPYGVDVDASGTPVGYREQLRAFGPSSHRRFRRCTGKFRLNNSTCVPAKAAA